MLEGKSIKVKPAWISAYSLAWLPRIAALFLLCIFVQGQTRIKSSAPPYQISGLKIMTYSQTRNSFSEDISESKDKEFWNALSLSLFIAIEISGKAGSYDSDRRVELIALEGRRLIIKKVARLGVLNDDTGKYYVPAWLYGPFCQPVTIKARILGQRASSAISKKIDFRCGE